MDCQNTGTTLHSPCHPAPTQHKCHYQKCSFPATASIPWGWLVEILGLVGSQWADVQGLPRNVKGGLQHPGLQNVLAQAVPCHVTCKHFLSSDDVAAHSAEGSVRPQRLAQKLYHLCQANPLGRAFLPWQMETCGLRAPFLQGIAWGIEGGISLVRMPVTSKSLTSLPGASQGLFGYCRTKGSLMPLQMFIPTVCSTRTFRYAHEQETKVIYDQTGNISFVSHCSQKNTLDSRFSWHHGEERK